MSKFQNILSRSAKKWGPKITAHNLKSEIFMKISWFEVMKQDFLTECGWIFRLGFERHFFVSLWVTENYLNSPCCIECTGYEPYKYKITKI